jgi:hypothetical protein
MGINPDLRKYRSDKHDQTCAACGATRLKWRIEGGTWRLFEDKRGDRNEKLLHQCREASPDDFEDLT